MKPALSTVRNPNTGAEHSSGGHLAIDTTAARPVRRHPDAAPPTEPGLVPGFFTGAADRRPRDRCPRWN